MDSAEAARDSAAAMVERTRRTIAQKTLVASFAGRLGIRKVDVGQYVSPGTGLITLQQLDPIFVDFPVPEQSLGLLKQGEPVNVTVDAYSGVTFTGVIVSSTLVSRRKVAACWCARNFRTRITVFCRACSPM